MWLKIDLQKKPVTVLRKHLVLEVYMRMHITNSQKQIVHDSNTV